MLIGSIKKPRLLNKIKRYLNLNVTLLKNNKGQYSQMCIKFKKPCYFMEVSLVDINTTYPLTKSTSDIIYLNKVTFFV